MSVAANSMAVNSMKEVLIAAITEYLIESLNERQTSTTSQKAPSYTTLTNIKSMLAGYELTVTQLVREGVLFDGYTLGDWAVRLNDIQMLIVLCDLHNFDIFTKNRSENTVLRMAILCDRDNMITPILELLVKNVCRPHLKLKIVEKIKYIVMFIKNSQLDTKMKDDENKLIDTIMYACEIYKLPIDRENLIDCIFL